MRFSPWLVESTRTQRIHGSLTAANNGPPIVIMPRVIICRFMARQVTPALVGGSLESSNEGKILYADTGFLRNSWRWNHKEKRNAKTNENYKGTIAIVADPLVFLSLGG